ncbi:hypothetical protein F2P44_32595 [Massilia sp. CCM 8695]|uniref:Uncharacterized protein n=1 Tax=Massilia frigida TaxID=2609281 RepID=A0ABX0NGS6_9BURK|nr:hypothetical protein [Massilia frigida]NHZ83968.1 hypothetical protein [Massilia frigida]
MKFSYVTLSSTRSRFSKALASRGLGLSLSAAQNVWANIVVGKNFSAAKPQATKDDGIFAIPVDAERIQSLLRARSREINLDTAVELFSEAIEEDLAALSPGMLELLSFCKTTGSFLIEAGSDSVKLGVMDAKYPGYIPVGNLPFLNGREPETEWFATSSALVLEVVNGLLETDTTEIFASNFRLVQQKEDRVFSKFIGPRIELYGQVIAEKVISVFEPQYPDWEAVDFDRVRDLIYDTIASDIYHQKNTWLNADCDLAELIMDSVAARIRDGLKWLAIDAEAEGGLNDPVGTIAHTVRLCLAKILGMEMR